MNEFSHFFDCLQFDIDHHRVQVKFQGSHLLHLFWFPNRYFHNFLLEDYFNLEGNSYNNNSNHPTFTYV